jgi:hypothetical protein
MDNHHVAGKSNSPVTVPVSVNDHRAELSVAQYDWKSEVLQNPEGNPLLKLSARVRGFIDTVFHLLKNLLLKIPEALELLNSILVEKLGPQWWVGTRFERFV